VVGESPSKQNAAQKSRGRPGREKGKPRAWRREHAKTEKDNAAARAHLDVQHGQWSPQRRAAEKGHERSRGCRVLIFADFEVQCDGATGADEAQDCPTA